MESDLNGVLQGKNILIGITGGIAAYKVPILVRLFKKNGANVKIVSTFSALNFVSKLSLATLSENPVFVDFFNEKSGEWTNHVELGAWADVFLIAPLTANSLSKMATGQANNLLLATYLSAKCKVMIAPAMDLDMYAHPSTKINLNTLESFGVHVIPAEYGFLASGLTGKGRMAEPETIFGKVVNFFQDTQSWVGRKIIVTAGPTYEAIDPVRFIGNHSSGKMGFEIAKRFLDLGADVILVTGPTHQTLNHANLKRIDVKSATEMLEKVQLFFPSMNGGVFAAAVSDYRPVNQSSVKIKKSEETLSIDLVKNPDILAWAGQYKKEKQWLCGFALETNDLEENAKKKLKKKNLDFIVGNTLEDSGAGFGHDTNKITIFDVDNNSKSFELLSKVQVAHNIVDYISNAVLK